MYKRGILMWMGICLNSMMLHAQSGQGKSPTPATVLANIDFTVDSSSSHNKYRIKKTELLLADTLSIRLAGHLDVKIDSLFTIRSFNMAIVPETGEMSSVSCAYNRIPLKIKLLFADLKPGSIIVIDNIRVYNKKTRNDMILSPVVIEVL